MIDNFEDEPNRFLSNFYEMAFDYQGKTWPTVEHAYQAMKTQEPAMREAIRFAKTPGLAKRMGRGIVLRKHWEAIKIGLMHELLRAKFDNPDLAQRLLDTGNEYLREGNTWGDKFWGTVSGVGNNWLGLLLMEVREELRLRTGIVNEKDIQAKEHCR